MTPSGDIYDNVGRCLAALSYSEKEYEAFVRQLYQEYPKEFADEVVEIASYEMEELRLKK